MAFPAKAQHTESLQALACAVRQHARRDINASDVSLAMQQLGINALDPDVQRGINIDVTRMGAAFTIWLEDNDQALLDWQNSCAWTANTIFNRSDILSTGKTYTFYYSGMLDSYRGKYKEIAKKIARVAQDPMVKRIYENVSIGTGDKWNPSDIMALDRTKVTYIEHNLKNFDATKISKATREIHFNNLKLKAEADATGKKALEMTEGMDELYEYNKFIDDLFKSKELVGISLKKTERTPASVKMFDHKDFKGLKEALNLDLEITSVDYKPNAMKCIINFTLAGETGHFMDIRGFESSKILADVQMQLQKGTAANHGKATLPAFSLITSLSKGLPSVRATRTMRNNIFKGTTIPQGNNHEFTDYKIFDDYAFRATGHFSQNNFANHSLLWAEYISKLSGNVVTKDRVTTDVNGKLGNGRVLKYKDAAKYLKNKVQSYEVGYVLDHGNSEIAADIKQNIMKSVYSLAASKGFRIFGDKKITDYMSSSTYVKVGG